MACGTVGFHLQEKGVAAFPVYDALDVKADPHLRHRRSHFVLPEDCPTDDLIDGNPWRLSAVAPRAYRAAPRLGDDTEAVLRELLGLTRSEVERLRGAGVLA